MWRPACGRLSQSVSQSISSLSVDLTSLSLPALPLCGLCSSLVLFTRSKNDNILLCFDNNHAKRVQPWSNDTYCTLRKGIGMKHVLFNKMDPPPPPPPEDRSTSS